MERGKSERERGEREERSICGHFKRSGTLVSGRRPPNIKAPLFYRCKRLVGFSTRSVLGKKDERDNNGRWSVLHCTHRDRFSPTFFLRPQQRSFVPSFFTTHSHTSLPSSSCLFPTSSFFVSRLTCFFSACSLSLSVSFSPCPLPTEPLSKVRRKELRTNGWIDRDLNPELSAGRQDLEDAEKRKGISNNLCERKERRKPLVLNYTLSFSLSLPCIPFYSLD